MLFWEGGGTFAKQEEGARRSKAYVVQRGLLRYYLGTYLQSDCAYTVTHGHTRSNSSVCCKTTNAPCTRYGEIGSLQYVPSEHPWVRYGSVRYCVPCSSRTSGIFRDFPSSFLEGGKKKKKTLTRTLQRYNPTLTKRQVSCSFCSDIVVSSPHQTSR